MARPRSSANSRSTGDYRHDAARQRGARTTCPTLFDQLTGRVSLPFQPGEHRRIAVKVIDQQGNEVMRVVGISP